MRDEDAVWLREHCHRIIYWIAELQASDEQLYNTLANTRDNIFGRTNHQGKKNTALAALAGAAEKLSRGDLSQKQLDNIRPIFTGAAKHGHEPVVFEEPLKKHSHFNDLFEQKG